MTSQTNSEAVAVPPTGQTKAVKKSKKRKPTSSASRSSKPTKPGGKRAVGKTTGVGVEATWVHVFANNAKNKMTDPEITKFMNSEFPGKKSKVFGMVQAVRHKYNKGGFAKGVAPKVQSHRYDDAGAITDPGTKTAARKAAKVGKSKTKVKPKAKATKAAPAAKVAKSKVRPGAAPAAKASAKGSPVKVLGRFQMKKKAATPAAPVAA